MKRNAKQSSRSSGSGGRLRLTLLLATAAALLLVPAAVASAANNVHIKIEGSGSGKVVGSPGEAEGTPPVNCEWNGKTATKSGACDVEAGLALEFLPYITVEAQPAGGAAGSVFAGWTVEEGTDLLGGCEEPLATSCGISPAYNEITEEFSGEVKLKAAFSKAFTVSKVGEGTVTGENSGIVCGPAKASCSAEYTGPETLTASPANGYAFSSWKGCATKPTALTCTVTASAATLVTATFVKTPSLKITKAGTGAGKVTATGIGCDENCSEAKSAVKTGTLVTVKVAPAKGSEAAIFESGTGSAAVPACEGAGPCTFTISEDSSVIVKFNPIPTNTLTVNLTGPGAYKGKVTGAGTLKGLLSSKVNCGSGCTKQEESFFSTDTVTLTAVASTGYTFAGWKGAVCESFGTSPCPVATSSPKAVEAEFK